VPNFVTIGQAVAEIRRFLDFRNGGRTPSHICYACVWTTHEEHLAVLLLCKIWLDSAVYSLQKDMPVFSERELTFTFTFAICCRPSVCLSSVCLSSETFVRPTQAVQIFGNISTELGALAIYRHPLKISRRSSQGHPSTGGVKHK